MDQPGVAPEAWGGWRLLALLTAAVFVVQLAVGAILLLDVPPGPDRDWGFLAGASVVTGLLIGPLTFLATRFVYGRRLTNRQLVIALLVLAVLTAVTGFLLVGLLFVWWTIPPLLLVWAMLARGMQTIEEEVPGEA